MEEIYLNRLNKFMSSIKDLSNSSRVLCALCSWSEQEVDRAKITSSKLQSLLTRFSNELYQYFNVSTNPNAGDISTLTTDQLESEEILAELNTRIQVIKEKATTSSSSQATNVTTHRGKLPDLNLPIFSGDILQWSQFWDQFSSNIDQRELRDVDKLLYLKASLKGEAKTILDGLETTNDNYKVALETLIQRYGKSTQIIDAHYSTLYKVKRAERPEECRKTLDEIERHLRVLNTLGENTDQNHLRFMIMEKFPEDIIYELKLKITENTVEEIRKQLHIILSAREEAKRTFGKKTKEEISYTTETLHVNSSRLKNRPKSQKPKSTKETHKRLKPNITAFNRTDYLKRKFNNRNDRGDAGPDPKRRRISCIFCQGEHFNDKCTKYKTVNERKQQIGKRCFICLGKGHFGRTCLKKAIPCYHCKKRESHNSALCPNKHNTRTESTNAMHVHERGSTILQTAVVSVKGPEDSTLRCRLLLDSGSQRSYVTQDTAKKLNLPVLEEQHLMIFTFGTDKPREINSSLMKLNIQTRTDKHKIIFANVVPSITQGISSHSEELTEWNHKDYPLADDGSLSDRVDILIGNDYYHSLMSTEKVKLQENLYLVNSEFGWILSGKTSERVMQESSVLTYFQASYETKLSKPDLPLDNGNVKVLWDLEAIGITDSPSANREEEAIKHFNENTVFNEGRYYVSWPWKTYPPELPTNFGLAYGRLVGLLKRLDNESLESYSKTLEDQLKRGIIEIVPDHIENDRPVHYLPHHGVNVAGKPLRIVYDASAKSKDTKSLNECLYCGPMMLEDLTGLLIKFRCYAVGMTADVEKAFLQIGLKEKDRDVTRFLWLKDIHKPVNKENLLHYRFTRVPFGIISSPFLLNATIKLHLQQANRKYNKQLANDIYVDNVLTGANTASEAINLYKESKEMFSQISMNLREWSSNSKEFMKQITDTAKDTTVKTLGLDWILDSDMLHLRAKVNKNNDYTKRGILKTLAAIYDPCGFSAPTLLSAKLLLQQLWKNKVKWDTVLPDNLIQDWKTILEEMKQVEDICLPRNITVHGEANAQLHCFTDSSTIAYAAAIYLVQRDNVNFIIGKSRLVPAKDQENLKIPRLELLGVLIGSRLVKYVLKFLQLNVTGMTLWTDSQIVIDWYHSDKLLEPFVSRRIEEIKQNKDLIIRYVPSSLNPADVATRPAASQEDKSIWLTGPQFLQKDQSEWPSISPRTASCLAREDLLNTEKQKQVETPSRTKEPNTLDEYMKNIKDVQEKSFPEESKGKLTNLSRNLKLFVDNDGIVRCDSRLTNSDLPYDAKYPILLPKSGDLTEKIIKDIHEKNLHVGVPHTLSLVRQKYWIPHGRTQVQKILSKCAKCVKHGGGPYTLPETPALPAERVKYTSSFDYVGVDYFGPMYVRSENGQKKRWICLFTCLVIRAIHLEVVEDLTTDTCLMAFRRFIATRGKPTLILSDNATQFRLLAEVITEKETLSENIKWKFIPQLAPWHGGAYERLVAVVKHCLKRTLEKHMLEDNQLSTIIKEVEAVVNTRPLTYVGSDVDHILKPADFLAPGRCLNVQVLAEHLPMSGSNIKQQLIEGWKRGNIIMNEYRDMFINRYLLSLRERYRNSPKQARVRTRDTPQIGDIVQIKGESKNRESWKAGRIVEVLKGADEQCRVARVKVGNHIFTRSIAHLYPLEVDEDESNGATAEMLEHDMQKDTHIDHEYLPSIPLMESSDTEVVPGTLNIDNNDQIHDDSVTNSEIRHDTTDDTREKLKNTSMIDDIEMAHEQNLGNSESETLNTSDTVDEMTQERQRRAAAVQALEKIQKWTRDLMTTIN